MRRRSTARGQRGRGRGRGRQITTHQHQITKEEEEKFKEIKELECAICFEDLLAEENHSIIFSPCGHEICKKCTLNKNFTRCCFCNSNITSKRKIVTKLKLEENLICKGCNYVFDRKLKAPHSLSKCGHHLCKGCVDEKRAIWKLDLEKKKKFCIFKKCKNELVLEDLQPIIYHKKFLDAVLQKDDGTKVKINSDKFEEDFKKDEVFVKNCFDDLQKDLDYQKLKKQEFYNSFNSLNTIVNKTRNFDNYLSYQKTYIKTINNLLKDNEYKLQDDPKIKKLFLKIDEFKNNYTSNNNFISQFNALKKKYDTDKKINFQDLMTSFYYLKSISSKNYINSEISKNLLKDINTFLLSVFQKKIKTFTLALSKFIKDSSANFYNILNLKENTNFEILKNNCEKHDKIFAKLDFKKMENLTNKYSKNLFLNSNNDYLSFEFCKKKIETFKKMNVKKEKIVEIDEDLCLGDIFD